MINIAICDDECRFIGQMEELLCGLQEKCGVTLEIDSFQSGFSLLDAIRRGQYYDIICLDIQMDGLDGLETAREIRTADRTVELIYLTSYDSYMKAVFEVAPSGFIVKPVDIQEFEDTMRRVIQVAMDQDAYYRFRYNKEEYKVPIRDILYFNSDLRRTNIVWKGGTYIEYKKLSEVSRCIQQTRGEFLRIHKSYLVNYRHIIRISRDKVLMSNGDELPVSDYRRQEVDGQLKKLMAMPVRM